MVVKKKCYLFDCCCTEFDLYVETPSDLPILCLL